MGVKLNKLPKLNPEELTDRETSLSMNQVFKDEEEWLSYLKQLGFVKPRHLKTATEGALLGALIASGLFC